MFSSKKYFLLLLSLAFLLHPDLNAQQRSEHSTVRGIVKIRGKEKLPSARVVLLDSDGTITQSTSLENNGGFEFSDVPIKHYRLQIIASGVIVYDEALPQEALTGSSVTAEITSDKALADVALLHPEQMVEVTATRQAEDVQTSASSVTVVSHSELQARNVQTLDQGLDLVPGLYVQRIQGLADTEASAMLRGFNGPNRTLVLLDGQPINDSFFGDVPWNVIPVDEVENVEIVRGPFSSLYGGNALGGVINIRLRRPEHRSIDLLEEYGSNATNRNVARYTESIGKLGLTAGYEHLKFGGYENAPVEAYLFPGTGDPVTGATVTTDPYGDQVVVIGTGGRNWLNQYSYRIAGDYAFTDATNLRMQYIRESYHFGHGPYTSFLRNSDGASTDAGLFQVTTPTGPQAFDASPVTYLQDPGAQQANFLSASFSHAWNSLGALRFDTGYNQIPSSNFTAPGSDATLTAGSGTYTNTNADNLHVNVQYYQTLRGNLLTVGNEIRHDEARNANYALSDWLSSSTNQGQTYLAYGQSVNEAVYAQDEVTLFEKLHLVAGGRYEYWKTYSGKINDYSSSTSLMQLPDRSDQYVGGKIGGSYGLPGGVIVRASVGNAFRNPTIYELYATFNAGGVTYAASPNVQSEHVRSWEAGLRKTFNFGLNVDLDYFQNDIDGLIYREPDLSVDPSGNYLTNVNAGHGRTRGVEISLQQKILPWISFRPSYTYIEAIITENPADPTTIGKYVPNTPKHMIAGQLLAVRSKWTGSITARYASATFETDQNLDTIRGVPGAYDPFFLMSANVNYRVAKHFELTGTSDNLLDRQFYQFYRTPGRSTYAGIRFRY